jgi:hypothetical protein
MLDNCNNCLCPVGASDVVTEEIDREKALNDNDWERKRLISDLEKCGVTFPVTELEMTAHRKLLDEYTDPEAGPDSENQGDDGDATISAENLTNEDYATTMPEDLKNLLRRYYQLEAEREALLRMAGTNTAPNSVDGDAESFSLRRVSTPRAPFWWFRRRSVAIIENEGDRCYEAQERSGTSRHVWVPEKEGDDRSQSSSHVTVVYPKERARKIRMGLVFCCLVILGLAAVTMYYAMNETEEQVDQLDMNGEINDSVITPSPTSSPTARQTQRPTNEPCTSAIVITGSCFVRSQSFGVSFNNCDPCKFKINDA